MKRNSKLDVQNIIHSIEKGVIDRSSLKILLIEIRDYLPEDSVFNSEMINHYCIESEIDLVYPLLEIIPEITEDYISEEKYKILDSYSDATIKSMTIHNIIKPQNYISLKNAIRNLVDLGHSRSSIFFTMKYLYYEKWEYYNKNRIILQLLNKTRQALK